MILNVFIVLIHAIIKKNIIIFWFTLIIFLSMTIVCYSKNVAFILNIVQYIFTCVF